MLRYLIQIALLLATTQLSLAQSTTPEQLCFDLAAHPWEPGNNGKKGVEWNRVDAERAIPACTEALAKYPDAPETAYGTAYWQGQGVVPDFAIAITWLRKGADHGHPIAQHNLSALLADGNVPLDLEESVRLETLAAESGYPLAMYGLGYLYELGIGVPRDYARSREWYNRAAARSNYDAYTAVARGFELGRGTAEDSNGAYNWWRGVAMDGSLYAQVRVGAAYEHGAGVEKDLAEALLWYGYAARGGDYGPGMFALGRLSLEQAKTPEETAIALQWLHRAAYSEQIEAYIVLAEHYEATGDFGSAKEMAELAIHYSQGPLAQLAQEIIDRIGDKATWPTTPGRFAANSEVPTENRPPKSKLRGVYTPQR